MTELRMFSYNCIYKITEQYTMLKDRPVAGGGPVYISMCPNFSSDSCQGCLGVTKNRRWTSYTLAISWIMTSSATPIFSVEIQ